ncbi:MAPEG family protein [Psychromarinibacter sp. C21-152]|uniref:MAPEG family protein n=1 Tax=Psychromarinibacter sediminicola TaxID=3033385 RepID=A0AAE3T8P6_9RHOB|nr:MAPEG family protein [Psychromarinibacter sediminicola]MDF0599725.1 MAPEG family protein [Psychromarinibacter sediminicola]
MIIIVTPIYAGLLALLLVVLSARVIQGRYRYRVSVGDGGNADLAQRMRAQANCAEYAPIGLILLLAGEAQGMPYWMVHLFGVLLVLGRLLHAYGFGRRAQVMALRTAGMLLTLAMLVLSGAANIAYAFL